MTVFDKNIIATACFFLAVAIGGGAFGAHGLKSMLTEASLTTFETGIRYQIYHCFAILILGLISAIPMKTKRIVFWLFFVGIIFFSGSIYFLSLKDILPFNLSGIGFITPIGGMLFIMGWILFAFSLIKCKKV